MATTLYINVKIDLFLKINLTIINLYWIYFINQKK